MPALRTAIFSCFDLESMSFPTIDGQLLPVLGVESAPSVMESPRGMSRMIVAGAGVSADAPDPSTTSADGAAKVRTTASAIRPTFGYVTLSMAAPCAPT